MIDGSPDRWSSVAKWLHWTIALSILAEVPAGYVMGRTYASKNPDVAALHKLLSQIHQTIGLLMIAAILFRLFWRWRHPAPALPQGTSAGSRWLARGVQAVLYALLMMVPLAGWAALSSLADSPNFPHTELWFFGYDGFGPGGMIPRIATPVAYNGPEPLNYGFFAGWHRWLVMIGGAALLLHIGGALRHHFVLKDNVLRRMLPSLRSNMLARR